MKGWNETTGVYKFEPFRLQGNKKGIILKSLWDCEEFDKNITKIIEKMFDNGSLNEKYHNIIEAMLIFCNRYTLSIEIYKKKTNKIIRIYFPKYIRIFNCVFPHHSS